MSNLDATDLALQSLLNTFTNERSRTGRGRLEGLRGDSTTRLERALNDNTAARDIQVAIRETIATQREIAVLRERERLEQERAAREAAERQRRAVSAVYAQADADLRSRVSDEDFRAVQDTAYQRLYRERFVQELIQQTPITDFTDEDQFEALSNLQAAQQVATVDRQRILPDEQRDAYANAIEFEEGFSNRNQSAFNPIAFGRNVIGGAIGAIGGVADIAATVGTGGLASPVGAALRDLGGSIGELVDDTSFGSSVNRARRSQERQNAVEAGTPESFFDGLRNDVTSLNAGAVADTVANLGSVLAGGAALNRAGTAAGRGIARATGAGSGGTGAGGLLARLASPTDRATDALSRARASVARGGGSALLAGAGLQQQDSQTPDDEGLIGEFGGDRFQAAGTNLLANLALAGVGGLRRTLPGTNIPIGSLVSGVEGAVAQGGAGAIRGAALRPRNQVIREGGGTIANLARDAGDRALAGGTAALRQAGSEGLQELLQTGSGQLADTFGTNQNQFDASALGGAFGLGGVLGGAFGAGRVAGARAPAAPAPAAPATPPAAGPVSSVDPAGPVSSVDPSGPVSSVDPSGSVAGFGLTGEQANALGAAALNQAAPNGQFGPNLQQPASPVPNVTQPVSNQPVTTQAAALGPQQVPALGQSAAQQIAPNGQFGPGLQQSVAPAPVAPAPAPPPLSPQQINAQQQQTVQQAIPNGQFGSRVQQNPTVPPPPVDDGGSGTGGQPIQPFTPGGPTPAGREGVPAGNSLTFPTLTQRVDPTTGQRIPEGQIPQQQTSVVPESNFLTEEAAAQLDPNFTLVGETLVENPRSLAAQRRNQRVLNARAVNQGQPTQALPRPQFNGLTGEQINSSARTQANQAAPNRRFGDRLNNRPDTVAPATEIATAEVSTQQTTTPDVIEATAEEANLQPAFRASQDGTDVELPAAQTAVTNASQQTTEQQVDTSGVVPEALLNALENGNPVAVRNAASRVLAEGQLTADDIVAEFERVNPDVAFRQSRRRQGEEEIDDVPTESDTLFDFLTRGAQESDQSTVATDTEVTPTYTVADLDGFLTAGRVREAVQAARQLHDTGVLDQNALIDSGFAEGVSNTVSERFIDQVTQFPRRQEADTRSPEEILDQQILDADNAVAAARDRFDNGTTGEADIEQINQLERRAQELREQRVLNNFERIEADAAANAASGQSTPTSTADNTADNDTDTIPLETGVRNLSVELPPSEQEVFDAISDNVQSSEVGDIVNKAVVRSSTNRPTGTVTRAFNRLESKGLIQQDGELIRLRTQEEIDSLGELEAAASRSLNADNANNSDSVSSDTAEVNTGEPTSAASTTVPNRTEFNPETDIELVDGRALSDTVVRAGQNAPPIQQQENENAITNKDLQKEEFDQIDAPEPYLNQLISQNPAASLARLLRDYAVHIPKIALGFLSQNVQGIYLNGAVTLNQQIGNSNTGSIQYVIAHELGHASHSLLGSSLTSDPSIRSELQAIEQQLYPGLREAVQQATAEGKNPNTRYYNYLLSAKELIAEFNALRILDPDTAVRIAPNLNSQMEFAAAQSNLLVRRSTHPVGFLGGHLPVTNRPTVRRGSADGPQVLEARNFSERAGPTRSLSASRSYETLKSELARGLKLPFLQVSRLASVMSAFDPEVSADTIAETYVSLARSSGINLTEKELDTTQTSAQNFVRYLERTRASRNQSSPQALARRRAKRTLAVGNNAVSRPENSRAPVPLSKTQIKRYAASKLSTFNIEVINDPATELDENVNARILEDTGYEWDDSVDAAIFGTTIYLNGNNIFNERDIDLALIHEILGHAGLREAHGPNLNNFLSSVLDSYGGLEGLLEAADRANLSVRADYAALITRAQTRQGIGYNQDHLTLAEEVLVGIVEADEVTQAERGLIAQIGEAIRDWINRLFPNVGRHLGQDVIADWELLQYAREASAAGRRLLDGAQTEGTPRVYLSRSRVRAIDRVRSLADNALNSDAVEFGKNVLTGDAPASARFAGLNESVKVKGRNIKLRGRLGTTENAYNRFFRNIINNRRPLQLTSQVMREDWAAAPRALVTRIVNRLDTVQSTSKNIRFRKKREDTERAILTNFFDNFFGRDANLDSKLEILKDKVALYEKITTGQGQAELAHFRATQVIDGDFRAAISMLAQATEGRFTSQREAYDFADTHRRIVHGFERNEAFFYDFRKNQGNLKKWLSADAFAQLEAIRALTRATDATAVEPEVAFRRERAIIDREFAALDPSTRAEIAEVRLNDIRTTGPNTSTLELRQQLADLNITPEEQLALDQVHNVLGQYIELANTTRDSWQGNNQDFNDQIRRYGWQFYSPQWTAADTDSEFQAGSRHYDTMASTFDEARGQENETVSPIAAIIQMTNDQFHDRQDNEITKDVIGLWALAQSSEGARLLGQEWGQGRLEFVRKGTSRYRRLMRRNNPDLFIHHLNESSAELAAAATRGEVNEALRDSPDNFVMVLRYKRNPEAVRTNSHIPDLVKGRKLRSATLQRLRDSDNPGIQVLTGGARFMGLTNTKYNPKHYLNNLLRETVASYSTVGAKLGVTDGLNEFATESMSAAIRVMPQISQFLYYSGLPGREAADRLAAIQADPDMADFLEFWESGASTHLSRSLTLNGRIDDLTENLRARGLTPDANLRVQEADRLVAVLPMLTDIVGRFAAYKTFRKNNQSIQQAAFETRSISDFAQEGESAVSDWGTTLFMFFRSGMVGLGQIVDLALDSRYNTEAAGVAAAVSTLLFGLGYGLAGDDENGDNKFLTQGESPTHFKFFLGDDIIQVPWSYNPFTAVAAITQQGLFAATGNQSFTEASTNMLDIIMTNLTPIGNNIPLTDGAGNFSTQKALQKFSLLGVPSLFTPAAMMAMNVNNFGGQITSPLGVGSAGRFGRVFDTPGNEIGNLSEDITRGLFDSTGFPLDVRRVGFLLNNYFNGPTFTYNAAKEWGRIATGGSDYEPNWRLGAFVLSGAVGTPNSSVKDRYYETRNQLADINTSINALQRSGFTEPQAQEYVRASVGERRYQAALRFEDLDQRASDLGTQMKDIRLSNILTDETRLTEYNRLKDQQTREIGRVISQLP